jgi:hypothetical protein
MGRLPGNGRYLVYDICIAVTRQSGSAHMAVGGLVIGRDAGVGFAFYLSQSKLMNRIDSTDLRDNYLLRIKLENNNLLR